MNIEFSASRRSAHPAGSAVSPGVIVFSPSMRLLHMNEQALVLSRTLNSVQEQTPEGGSGDRVLPEALRDLCDEIVESLNRRMEAEDWTQFEIKRIAGTPEQPILLRGFGLPDRQERQRSRVVITLQAMLISSSPPPGSFCS